MEKQYKEALELLESITRDFLGGDKSRVVIIPGNHDICWTYSKQSMKRIDVDLSGNDKDKLKLLVNNYFNYSPATRWSWRDLSFYEIIDQAIYNDRLKLFCEFYTKFYEGKRNYSLLPHEQYDIFDYPDFGITVVGFNSCYENDHLNGSGKIHPDCIGHVGNVLRSFRDKGRLLIAAWHHNIRGLPLQSDYMDSRIIKNLIDFGFSLGFHGHQHKSEVVDDYFRYKENRKITVISAGTLCGGPDQLPNGESRQYNLLEIDLTNNSAKLHSREMMKNSAFEVPVWGPGRIETINQSYLDIQLQQPSKPKPQTYKMLSVATDHIKNKDFQEALSILSQLDFTNDFVRGSVLECYVGLEHDEKIIQHFSPPKNAAEAIHLINALWNMKKIPELKVILNHDVVKNADDPSLVQIKNKFLSRI
jgi:hypothetical protein